MDVGELLNEIKNGGMNKLPNKIKVDGKIFYRDFYGRDYYTKLKDDDDDENGKDLLSELLSKYSDIQEILLFPVTSELEMGSDWQPAKGEVYYYIVKYCDVDEPIIDDCVWDFDGLDIYRYNNNNCFRTKEQALYYAKWHNQMDKNLREIAENMNNGVKVSINKESQTLFFLGYDENKDEIIQKSLDTTEVANSVFCINPDFVNEVMKLYTKDDLKSYLKGSKINNY